MLSVRNMFSVEIFAQYSRAHHEQYFILMCVCVYVCGRACVCVCACAGECVCMCERERKRRLTFAGPSRTKFPSGVCVCVGVCMLLRNTDTHV